MVSQTRTTLDFSDFTGNCFRLSLANSPTKKGLYIEIPTEQINLNNLQVFGKVQIKNLKGESYRVCEVRSISALPDSSGIGIKFFIVEFE